MRVPILDAFMARKRWQNGRPELTTFEDIEQARRDAPYWAALVKEMPEFDEEFHTGHAYRLAWIADASFWHALVKRFSNYDHGFNRYSFWQPLSYAAMESGNTIALDALAQQYAVEELWDSTRSDFKATIHPRTLTWFKEHDTRLDEELAQHTYDIIRKVKFFRDTMYDALHATSGAESLIHWSHEWCKLPDTWRDNEESTWQLLSHLSAQLNLLKHHPDSPGVTKFINFNADIDDNAVDINSTSIQKMIDDVVHAQKLDPVLVRLLTFRMQAQDYTDPLLCSLQSYLYRPELTKIDALRRNIGAMDVHQRYLSVVHKNITNDVLGQMIDLTLDPSRDIQSQLYTISYTFRHPEPKLDMPSMNQSSAVFDAQA